MLSIILKFMLGLLSILNANQDKTSEDVQSYRLFPAYDDSIYHPLYLGGTAIMMEIDGEEKVCGFIGDLGDLDSIAYTTEHYDEKSDVYFVKDHYYERDVACIEMDNELPIDAVFINDTLDTTGAYDDILNNLLKVPVKRYLAEMKHYEQMKCCSVLENTRNKFIVTANFPDTNNSVIHEYFYGLALTKDTNNEEKVCGFCGYFTTPRSSLSGISFDTKRIVFFEKNDGYEVFVNNEKNTTGLYNDKIECVMNHSGEILEELKHNYGHWLELMRDI